MVKVKACLNLSKQILRTRVLNVCIPGKLLMSDFKYLQSSLNSNKKDNHSLRGWWVCSLSSSVGQEPWVWDKQQPTHLQAWLQQGLGSLVTPVLKATHNFHYSVMERMKEKNLRSRSTAKLLSGLLTDLLGMEWPPVHAFSYYYSEVFTVCNFPPSFLTATTQV